MVKKFYEAPELEMIRLTVEAGFAATGEQRPDGSTSGDGEDEF